MKTRPSRASVLSLLSFFLTAVIAQDENGGTHSKNFDPKYSVPENLLINPLTHPGLFSFTGRWLLSPARPTRPEAQIYQSSLWPGNSVTVLVHGSNVSVQVVPKSQGWIENYHFYVSVDGGDDVRYDIPAFNSSELTKSGEARWFEVKVEGLGDNSGDETDKQNQGMLQPHTLRLTSVPETPLSFEGVNVQNALISQGREWIEEQDRRVVMEFIGEGSDAEREGGLFGDPVNGKMPDSWRDSVQYRVGEALGVRHSHVSAGTCLLSCTKDIPGLATQYFQTSPLPVSPLHKPESKLDPHHPSHLKAPYRFPALSTRPTVPIPPATHLVVDVGIPDLVLNRQSATAYHYELSLFLTRIRLQAHPSAKILVVARSSEYIASRGIPSTPEIDAQRRTLYSVTRTVVDELSDQNVLLLPLSAVAETEEKAYLAVICPFLLPPAGVLSKLSMNTLGRSQVEWSKPQRVCLALGSKEDVSRVASAGWKGALVFMGLVGLWVSRGTLVGAVAAVFGRRRLGMEMVDVEGANGLLEEEGGREEERDKRG